MERIRGWEPQREPALDCPHARGLMLLPSHSPFEALVPPGPEVWIASPVPSPTQSS